MKRNPPHARTRVRRSSEAGLTLVELLVAIIAASFVAAGTFTFFAGQQRVYDTQTKVLTMQENLWASLETVTRYVRSAGAGMIDCVRLDPDGAGPAIGDPPPGSDTEPQTGLRAFRAGTGPFRIPPLWIRNGADGAPDTVTVAFGRGATGNFKDATLGATVDIGRSNSVAVTTLAGQTARFLAGEFILLVDEARSDNDRGCTLFRITSILSPTNTLLRSVASPWNADADYAAMIPFPYPGGTVADTGGVRNFGELTWVRLAIDSTGGPDVAPRLTLDRLDDDAGPQVLADGIEDLQIAYGCDIGPGAADGVIAEGTDAASRLGDEWTYNQTGDVPPVRCQRPDAVRITLVARTITEDTSLPDDGSNRRPSAEDGIAGGSDRFRHRVLTATVRMRN